MEIRPFFRICLIRGVDHRRVLLDGGIEVIEAHPCPPFALLEEVEGEVGGDLVNPGIEGGIAAKFPQRLIGSGENFLQQIVGVLLVGGHVVYQTVKLVAILQDQGIEGAGVALLGARHEVLVSVGGTGLTKHSEGGVGSGEITWFPGSVKNCESILDRNPVILSRSGISHDPVTSPGGVNRWVTVSPPTIGGCLKCRSFQFREPLQAELCEIYLKSTKTELSPK